MRKKVAPGWHAHSLFYHCAVVESVWHLCIMDILHTSSSFIYTSCGFCKLGVVSSWDKLNCRYSDWTISFYLYLPLQKCFLIKVREWKASREQSLPAGLLWKLTRSDEVRNWPTFKKPPKLQKGKWDSEIWSECKWRLLMIPDFVLDRRLLPGAQGTHCLDLLLTSCAAWPVGPATQKVLDVLVDYTWL